MYLGGKNHCAWPLPGGSCNSLWEIEQTCKQINRSIVIKLLNIIWESGLQCWRVTVRNEGTSFVGCSGGRLSQGRWHLSPALNDKKGPVTWRLKGREKGTACVRAPEVDRTKHFTLKKWKSSLKSSTISLCDFAGSHFHLFLFSYIIQPL